MEITKEMFKQALEDWRVVVVPKNDRETLYDVYIIENNRLIQIAGIGHYWSNKRGHYHCSAIGTSRPLEIILSIGKALGLDYNEIIQRYCIL